MITPNLRRVVAQIPRRNFCASSFPSGKDMIPFESNGSDLTVRWYFYRGVIFAAGFGFDWYRWGDHASKRQEELDAELRKYEKILEELRKPI